MKTLTGIYRLAGMLNDKAAMIDLLETAHGCRIDGTFPVAIQQELIKLYGSQYNTGFFNAYAYGGKYGSGTLINVQNEAVEIIEKKIKADVLSLHETLQDIKDYPTHRHAIVTKIVPATTTKPTRIKVTAGRCKPKYYSVPDADNIYNKHKICAEQFCSAMGWSSALIGAFDENTNTYSFIQFPKSLESV